MNPAFDGVAVKVTGVPWQTGNAGDCEIETEGVVFDSTDTVMMLLIELSGETHIPFEVIITLMLSPVLRDDMVKDGAFVPELIPFTCH